MQLAKTVAGLCVRGALAGSLLGVVAAPVPMLAGCTCNDGDYGTSSYQCNPAQTACIAGHEKCLVQCS